MCAAGGSGACNDEAANVGDYFDDDEPPGIVDFYFSTGRLFGVLDYFLYLLFRDSDFHDKYAFVYGCKCRQKLWG